MTYRATHQYALIDDGSATAAFVSRERVSGTDANYDEKELLRSGFRSSHLNTVTPLSAALQLNGDLTGLSDAQLTIFARAELERHNKATYRSYDIDADHRVCVIADNSRRLDEFYDTYGGILEIEPLLIGAYHRDYATVEELDIDSSDKGYTIGYTVKSPVNRGRCTYCGICGAVCPERCILDGLYFDFGRCTYCTDCVKACPVDAIDLYSIERISVDVPALIILGDPHFTEPRDTAMLFRETDLERYLATVFSCKVDEVITCNHELCHFNGSSETGCSACLSACTFNAVKTNGSEIEIDSLSCTECGKCIGACPTGALQNQKLTDRTFIEFFRTCALDGSLPARVILGSDSELHRFWWRNNQKRYEHSLFIEIPEAHALTTMHLIFLAASGAEQIIILHPDTETGTGLQRSISDTNTIISKTRGGAPVVSLLSEYESLGESVTPGLPEQSGFYHDLSFVNRRRKLSSVVHYLCSHAETAVSFKAGEIQDWGTITCDTEKCTQCLACLNVCKIESLSADEENLALCWNGGLCIGCTGCVTTCPEQALTINSSLMMNSAFFTDTVIAQAEPVRCKSCNKIFGTKKSLDRVIEVLTAKQGRPPKHLEYCEDCRVMKLMESE